MSNAYYWEWTPRFQVCCQTRDEAFIAMEQIIVAIVGEFHNAGYRIQPDNIEVAHEGGGGFIVEQPFYFPIEDNGLQTLESLNLFMKHLLESRKLRREARLQRDWGSPLHDPWTHPNVFVYPDLPIVVSKL